MEFTKAIFHLIRYVPDVVRNEPLNIGIILYEVDGENPKVAVRMTKDWSRVLCCWPDADIAYLEGMESDIAKMLQSRSEIETSIAYFKRQWTSPLEVVDVYAHGAMEPRAVMFLDFDQEVQQLMRMYVDPPPRSFRGRGGKAAQKARR